jgi:hypothetical protein
LENDPLLKTLHPLVGNVLQTFCSKLQDSGACGFDVGASFSCLKKPSNRMGGDLDRIVDVLMGMMAVPITKSAPYDFQAFEPY